MPEGDRPILTDNRRGILKKAAMAAGTLLGLGVAGAYVKAGLEGIHDITTPESSPDSTAGYRVVLGNNKDTAYYSADGEPFVVESGTEFTATIRTKDGEKKVGTGIKIATAIKPDGSKTLAFQVDTPSGEKEWLPVDPKLSAEPIADPFFLVVSKDQRVLSVYGKYQPSSEGKDTFKLRPAKFNRSPVSNPVNRLP